MFGKARNIHLFPPAGYDHEEGLFKKNIPLWDLFKMPSYALQRESIMIGTHNQDKERKEPCV